MSKSQSGLGSVKRDWSANPPASSQEIEWLPTPPKPVALPQPAVSSSGVELTGKQKRLRDIQNAINNRTTPTIAHPFAKPKRASDTEYPEASGSVPPTKKPRQLPPGYREDDPMTRSTQFTSSSRAAAPPSKKIGKVFLSSEQKQILKLAEEGHSLFYTGSAGTGKSVLLREIIKSLRKKFVKSTDAVAITASTGIAACNIGGITIHSFAGIGLGIETAENLANKIRKNKKSSTRWLRTQVLIIDEVSMLDGELFDKLSRIGSILRKRPNSPFGGIQLIVTGDFFQLPPVAKGPVKFAFEADYWSQTVKRTFNLTQVFRQSDQEFVDMLNEMRFGRMTQKSIDKFRSLSRPIKYDDGLGPTELFPRREDVDRSNSTRMANLNSITQTFQSSDGGTVQDIQQRDKMLSNFMAVQQLTLRVDAQVMLIKNIDETFVNGSMGRVVRFADTAVYGSERDVEGSTGEILGGATKRPAAGRQWPVVEFLLPYGGKRTVLVPSETFKIETPSGEIPASRSQLPLILAWAMSIHKSQGQTLDRVKVDLGKVFEKGQAYVALSRATSLEGLQVLNFDPSKVQAHPKVAEWSKTLETIAGAA